MAKKKTNKKQQSKKRRKIQKQTKTPQQKKQQKRKNDGTGRTGDFLCTIVRIEKGRGFGIVNSVNSRLSGYFELKHVKFDIKLYMEVRAILRRNSGQRKGLAYNLERA